MLHESLTQYQILDLTTGGSRLAGRILADMGAEVIRIVPADYQPDVAAMHLDDGLSLVMLDYNEPDGRAMLLDLALGTDVFIESFPPGLLDSLGLGCRTLIAGNPGLVYVSITPFGQEGLYHGFVASDLTVQTMSGWLSVTGLPEMPLKLPGEQAYHTAALFAVNGLLLALRQRRKTGQGQHLDISAQECAAAALDHILVRHTIGESAQRQGSLQWNSMFRIFPCRDGHILLSIHRQWATLVGWMAAEVMSADLEDDCYVDEQYRRDNISHIIEVIERWTQSHTVNELVETGQLMRFPWAKIVSLPETLNDNTLVNTPGLPWRSKGADA